MHDLEPLDHRPSVDTDHAAILLHGRHRPPGDMRDLALAIGMTDWRCVFPAADEACWYPKGFMSPREENEEAIAAAVGRIAMEVDRLCDEGFDPSHILIGGFSQGGCVACEYLARRPKRHLAALILSGGLTGPEGTTWPKTTALEGMPVLITASGADPWMPLARSTETADWFRDSGADVRLEVLENRPHMVDDRDIAAATALVADLVGDPDQRP